ncbi:MAG: hypothetical protein VSS75_031800 [Candidatus Parabeggiatoa sp.]|nr:hypothetical protein [Candidatus Parabeggiatoa sp.]
MGLDIYHYKISKSPKEEYDYFEYKDFPIAWLEKNDNESFIAEVIEEDEISPIKVIYFEKIGNQRKGMNLDFFYFYENCKIYTEKEDFENLLKFINEKSSLANKQNIIDNFISKYVSGSSFLWPSW